MSKIPFFRERKKWIEENIKEKKFIQEYLFYKEEQLLFTSDIFKVRNNVEWIIQINKLLEFIYYSIESAYNEYKLSESTPMTLNKNEN